MDIQPKTAKVYLTLVDKDSGVVADDIAMGEIDLARKIYDLMRGDPDNELGMDRREDVLDNIGYDVIFCSKGLVEQLLKDTEVVKVDESEKRKIAGHPMGGYVWQLRIFH